MTNNWMIAWLMGACVLLVGGAALALLFVVFGYVNMVLIFGFLMVSAMLGLGFYES